MAGWFPRAYQILWRAFATFPSRPRRCLWAPKTATPDQKPRDRGAFGLHEQAGLAPKPKVKTAALFPIRTWTVEVVAPCSDGRPVGLLSPEANRLHQSIRHSRHQGAYERDHPPAEPNNDVALWVLTGEKNRPCDHVRRID